MSSYNRSKIVGGFWGLLFIILFIAKVLELGQFGTWSWWWVTAPLWGPFVVALGIRFAFDLVGGLFHSTMRLFK